MRSASSVCIMWENISFNSQFSQQCRDMMVLLCVGLSAKTINTICFFYRELRKSRVHIKNTYTCKVPRVCVCTRKRYKGTHNTNKLCCQIHIKIQSVKLRSFKALFLDETSEINKGELCVLHAWKLPHSILEKLFCYNKTVSLFFLNTIHYTRNCVNHE